MLGESSSAQLVPQGGPGLTSQSPAPGTETGSSGHSPETSHHGDHSVSVRTTRPAAAPGRELSSGVGPLPPAGLSHQP